MDLEYILAAQIQEKNINGSSYKKFKEQVFYLKQLTYLKNKPNITNPNHCSLYYF